MTPSFPAEEALAPESQPSQPSQAPKEASTAVATVAARSYRIVAGDTLARIALRFYGDAGKWRDLAKANPGLDPRRPKVGAIIALPETAGARSGVTSVNASQCIVMSLSAMGRRYDFKSSATTIRRDRACLRNGDGCDLTCHRRVGPFEAGKF